MNFSHNNKSDSKKLSYQQSLDKFVEEQLAAVNKESTYRQGSLALKVNALSNTFASTQAILTEKIFASLAQVFVEHFPSTHWDINTYGEPFAEFILSQKNSAKTDVNWEVVAELASLEYFICTLYYYEEDMGAEFISHHIELFIPLLSERHPYLTIQLDKGSNHRKIARMKHGDYFRIYLT